MRALVLGGGGGGLPDVISALHLGWEGVAVAHSGLLGGVIQLCQRLRPDVVIVDRDGADSQWLGAVHEARQVGSAAVVVVSRHYDEGDLIEAVEAGADEYMSAPINRSVFVAKVRAALRRLHTRDEKETGLASCGDLIVDPDSHEASIRGQRLSLTTTEFDILLYLVRHAGLAARKELLCGMIWGEDAQVYSGNLRKHIEHLRRKLREIPDSGIAVVTLPRVGYKLVEERSGYLLRTA